MILSEFHVACCNGNLEKVKEYFNVNNLNEINVRFEEIEDDEWTLIERRELTPLICAIENNHLLIVKYLHQQGANLYLLQ
jgi:ankyrin repeat protein